MKKVLLWTLPLVAVAFATLLFRATPVTASTMATPPPNTIAAGAYKMDMAHSQILFKVKHMGISTVTGWIAEGEAKINVPQTNLNTMQIEATMKSGSINTNNQGRDNHLRSPDFFDATAHPTMSFKSTRVVARGNNLTITGQLTMRGVTKPVTLTGKYLGSVTARNTTKAGFEATGRINRKDFGVSWSNTMDNGGLVVSDMVDIQLEIEANKQ